MAVVDGNAPAGERAEGVFAVEIDAADAAVVTEEPERSGVMTEEACCGAPAGTELELPSPAGFGRLGVIGASGCGGDDGAPCCCGSCYVTRTTFSCCNRCAAFRVV